MTSSSHPLNLKPSPFSSNLQYVCVSLCLFLLLIFPSNGVSQSIVRNLPGFTGPLPFELETGYVNVDESNGVELFYYFIKSENNPKEDPLVFWMTGGPGCSGLSGLAFEIGPFSVKKDVYNGTLPTLVLNPYSWTKIANIIFIDSPVGTGFSYSKSVQGWKSSDKKSAKHAYIFIKKWMDKNTEFLPNPFYVCGDSYSGIIAPILMQEILQGIAADQKPCINIKGYLLGNPITNRDLEEDSKIPFWHGMGIISHEMFQLTEGLETGHTLEPDCTEEHNRHNILLSPTNKWSEKRFECRSYSYMLLYYWTNDDAVQKALNIRQGTIQEWIRCNKDIYDNIPYTQDVKNAINYHLNLSKRHIYSLIYSGDHDGVVPFLSTQIWIKSLNYTIRDDWRPWYVDGQVFGYTRAYKNNMVYATIKGACHVAVEHKPKEGFVMFKRWISYNSL